MEGEGSFVATVVKKNILIYASSYCWLLVTGSYMSYNTVVDNRIGVPPNVKKLKLSRFFYINHIENEGLKPL